MGNWGEKDEAGQRSGNKGREGRKKVKKKGGVQERNSKKEGHKRKIGKH